MSETGVTVKVPLNKLAAVFDRKYADQVPFAASVALNKVAAKARNEVKRNLKDDFTIRSGGWVKRGIRAEFSTKRTLTAEVGSRDPFMRDQALGGTRSDGTQAIPVERRKDNPTMQTPATQRKVTKRKKPYPRHLADIKVRSRRRTHNAKGRAVRSRKQVARFFVLGKIGIFERSYPKKGKGKSKLVKVYRFKPSVRIAKRWTLARTVQAIVDAGFEEAFVNAMKKAIRTAR